MTKHYPKHYTPIDRPKYPPEEQNLNGASVRPWSVEQKPEEAIGGGALKAPSRLAVNFARNSREIRGEDDNNRVAET